MHDLTFLYISSHMTTWHDTCHCQAELVDTLQRVVSTSQPNSRSSSRTHSRPSSANATKKSPRSHTSPPKPGSPPKQSLKDEGTLSADALPPAPGGLLDWSIEYHTSDWFLIWIETYWRQCGYLRISGGREERWNLMIRRLEQVIILRY
jgi:hypothetical protein